MENHGLLQQVLLLLFCLLLRELQPTPHVLFLLSLLDEDAADRHGRLEPPKAESVDQLSNEGMGELRSVFSETNSDRQTMIQNHEFASRTILVYVCGVLEILFVCVTQEMGRGKTTNLWVAGWVGGGAWGCCVGALHFVSEMQVILFEP